MSIEPKLGYFSIWWSSFRLFRGYFGLMLWATLVVAGLFFVVGGLANAENMITLGFAAMRGSYIPPEQLLTLWLVLVGGDALALLALTVAFLMVAKYVRTKPQSGFLQFSKRELPRLFKSVSFWLAALFQVISVAMIDAFATGPEFSGAIVSATKVSGIILFGVTVLVMFSYQDNHGTAFGKRLKQSNWLQWLALFFMVLVTVPVLFVLMNGFLYMFFWLPLIDFGGQQIMHLFEQGSLTLPFTIVTIAKFISLWFNIVLMALLVCTHIAVRTAPAGSRKK